MRRSRAGGAAAVASEAQRTGPVVLADPGAGTDEAAVGDDEMQMGMPVGQGAVGLETGDDPDPEIGLHCGGAHARGDDAGCQPRKIAQEGPAVEAAGAEPLWG